MRLLKSERSQAYDRCNDPIPFHAAVDNIIHETGVGYSDHRLDDVKFSFLHRYSELLLWKHLLASLPERTKQNLTLAGRITIDNSYLHQSNALFTFSADLDVAT